MSVAAIRVRQPNPAFSGILFQMKRHLGKIFYGVALTVLIVLAGYFALQSEKQKLSLPLDETERLVLQLGESMELPKNETPLLITVSDKTKLDPRIFPKSIAEGDQILVYRIDRTVILYRPSTGKIIESASLPRETQLTAEIQNGPGVMAPPTLALYIATDDAARVAEIEKRLVADFPELIIEQRENAQRRDYQGVVIANPSYFRSELAERLAATFDGVFEETLPIGERVPSSDILLIIGEETGRNPSKNRSEETLSY